MKLRRLFAIIGIALSCALFTSCAKEESSSKYESVLWIGNYPTQTQNNDTKEMEEHTACISLQFARSGLECIVERGIVGMYSINRIIYEVKWYSKNTFTLCETQGGQTIQYYSGTIKGNKMSFEFLSCDKVERTIELEKVELN
ncbi:MAG: hypothetical protein MJY97_10610 [Bacteroidales bacterium]|nr:hypothetical protein [Bacteroidales bacterium]